MRPRVFPAEDAEDLVRQDGYGDASMRPRVFPAEDGAFAAFIARGVQLLQ